MVPLIVSRFDAGVPMMLFVSTESLPSELVRKSATARLSVSEEGSAECFGRDAEDLPRGLEDSATLRSINVRSASIVVAS